MWTEAHRARHEAGLKEMVSTCAVAEMARWLERVDPPLSEKATPVLPVVSALTIHQFSRQSQSFGSGRARSINLTAVRRPRVNQESLLLASFLG